MVFPIELINRFETELPRPELEQLLMGLLKKERYQLYLPPMPIKEEIVEQFLTLLDKRKKGAPIQYLLHSTSFINYELYVDERVFIPRPETEELVIKTISRLSSPTRLLEIGTGSGAIAIALAKELPGAKIVATDISSAAIAVAKINIEKYDLIDRISLIQTNLFNLPEAESWLGQFDCLISNPPYIDRNLIQSLSAMVKNYEPRESLDGGLDGFEIIRIILKEGLKFLKPTGIIALEIDPTQKDMILKEIPWADFEIDLAGRIRFCFIENKEHIKHRSTPKNTDTEFSVEFPEYTSNKKFKS